MTHVQNNSKKFQITVMGLSALVLIGTFSTTFVNKAFAATNDGSSVNQCTLVSDTTTLANTGHGTGHQAAVLVSEINPLWTAVINGASWIWGTNPVTNHKLVVGGSQTFTKKFNLTSTPTDATLTIAADNDYAVWVNGTQIASTTNGNNYTSATSMDVSSYLKKGYNDVKITVVNLGQAGGNQDSNPAGLLYKLSIDNAMCGPTNGQKGGGSTTNGIISSTGSVTTKTALSPSVSVATPAGSVSAASASSVGAKSSL